MAAAPPPPYGDISDDDIEADRKRRSGGLYVVVPKSELEFIKQQIMEARLFAYEARESSRSNKQSIDEVIKPALDVVDEHEKAIQRSRGILIGLSAVWTIITVMLSLWFNRSG